MEEDEEVGRGSETGQERGVEEEGEYEQEGCEVIPDRGTYFPVFEFCLRDLLFVGSLYCPSKRFPCLCLSYNLD